MPLINTDDYKPPFWLPDSQSQTIFPSLFRKVEGVNYIRERIKTDDGDFLDIDNSPEASVALTPEGGTSSTELESDFNSPFGGRGAALYGCLKRSRYYDRRLRFGRRYLRFERRWFS